MALFAASGKITANPGKHLRPQQGAEAAGDLLFHLAHAEVLLALIVGERDVGVDQESQHAQVEVFEAVQQVSRFTLFGAALARLAAGMEVTALA